MTTIGGRQFRCPDCGGDTVREFCETLVSCDIVRFGLHEDGAPFVDEETEITLEKTTGEPEYKCASCGRQFEIRELPTMLAAVGEPGNMLMPDPMPDGDQWQAMGSVTIDTGTILLIDPIHGRADVGTLGDSEYAQVAIPGGDYSAMLVSTGMGDGRYLVEGRFADSPFGRRIAEIRVRFLDEDGDWAGGEQEES